MIRSARAEHSRSDMLIFWKNVVKANQAAGCNKIERRLDEKLQSCSTDREAIEKRQRSVGTTNRTVRKEVREDV